MFLLHIHAFPLPWPCAHSFLCFRTRARAPPHYSPVYVYTYSMFSDQLLEISAWDNVHTVDIVTNLLLEFDPSANGPTGGYINLVQMSVQHAFRLHHKLLYLEVSYVLTEVRAAESEMGSRH